MSFPEFLTAVLSKGSAAPYRRPYPLQRSRQERCSLQQFLIDISRTSATNVSGRLEQPFPPYLFIVRLMKAIKANSEISLTTLTSFRSPSQPNLPSLCKCYNVSVVDDEKPHEISLKMGTRIQSAFLKRRRRFRDARSTPSTRLALKREMISKPESIHRHPPYESDLIESSEPSSRRVRMIKCGWIVTRFRRLVEASPPGALFADAYC